MADPKNNQFALRSEGTENNIAPTTVDQGGLPPNNVVTTTITPDPAGGSGNEKPNEPATTTTTPPADDGKNDAGTNTPGPAPKPEPPAEPIVMESKECKYCKHQELASLGAQWAFVIFLLAVAFYFIKQAGKGIAPKAA